MNWIEMLKAFVQGIVQGVTEWLPISSTGHILLLDAVWKMNLSEAFFDIFKVVIQLGSIMAVIVLFFNKLNPFSIKKTQAQRQNTWQLWGKVLIASVPAAAAGLLLDDWIDTHLEAWYVIAPALAVYGGLFIWMERRQRQKQTIRIHNFEQLSWRTALLIGAFQMLALIPGTSRSGATILGAVLLGASRYIAAEFSFFMAIPVMFGASGLKLVKHADKLSGFTSTEWGALLVGTVVAFIVSLITIRFLIDFVKKHSFEPFGWYRIGLATAVTAYFLLIPH